MFLGNLPVKYNSEGVGTAATTPTNANPDRSLKTNQRNF